MRNLIIFYLDAAELSIDPSIDEPATVLAARDMIQILVEDHSKIIERLKNWVYETADDARTQDYLLQRLEAHEKMVWMLKASF